jgi:hypothetical protein
MSNFIFWAIWLTISALGVKYSADKLLNESITFQTSIILMLIYQWIRFAKPLDKTNNDKTKTLPPPNTVNRNKRK